MKTHTQDFKNTIIQMGRQLDGIISYDSITLNEEIMSITPHFNANLLKSVMKQLDLELSVDIPLNTVINCQIGILVGEEYEMLNFGNYVVYSSEKQEDTKTYKIVCYDKMLYAMKQNEDLGISYPISIKNYLIAIARKIGLNVANQTFYNENMMIQSEIYLGQEYTYRDILDEIAQSTGSIICLNENDEIQVKYPTITNDTIDEDYLKDINVDFGKKYGPINSIVLSRAGESDNVYLRDEESVAENGLTEVKIVDNQIMNFNNRGDYLQGILNALNGLYYYLNDFNSTGILYYDVGDLYNVQIEENTYQCLMLNDEINVTTGIEEIIHTDMPEQSETDYEKADKTNMKINKTYLIVDKQNQTIESVVNNVTAQNNKISQITQTVDEINSKIQDIADITKAEESFTGNVSLTDINESEPIMIKVHPTSTNISYLYPRENLYPSDLQYLPNRIIRFTRTYEENNETLTENIDYELPDDLLRYSDTVYDEFYLNYDSQTCQIIKRCEYNADGTVSALGTEVVENYSYPQILLGDGDYQIYIYGYNYGYIYVRLMAQNIYTTQFATKAELTSEIIQTQDAINLKVSKNDIISNINQSAEEITIDAEKISLNGKTIDLTGNNITIDSDNFSVDKNGNIIATGGDIGGFKINEISLTKNLNGIYKYNNFDLYMAAAIVMNWINLSSNFEDLCDIDGDGIIDSADFLKIRRAILGTYTNTKNVTGTFTINSNDPKNCISISKDGEMAVGIGVGGINTNSIITSSLICGTLADTVSSFNGILLDAETGTMQFKKSGTSSADTVINYDKIITPVVIQTSKEEEKKNFVKFENAMNILKNIDIYKYNLKNENNNDKKHIGFVIGNDFNYSKEVTSSNNDGVDVYSFVSVCCQAIKEQQEQIEQMKKEIEELKGGK